MTTSIMVLRKNDIESLPNSVALALSLPVFPKL